MNCNNGWISGQARDDNGGECMRQVLKIMGIIVAITFLWLGVWMLIMRGDVARVEASLKHHNEALRTASAYVNLKVDDVHATGFPFRFQVAVVRPTLSMVDGDESFSVSYDRVLLTPMDAGQGRYRVELPPEVEAMYAKSGAAPEHYFVVADVVPKLNLSAADSTKPCGPLVGKPCADVAADAPIISYAVGFPPSITLTMTLNGESRAANFTLPSLAVPIFQPIPAQVARPLQLFVGVLREALVYKTK
jgi:hypothetical protein